MQLTKAIKDYANVQKMKIQMATTKGQVSRLKKQVQKLQHAILIKSSDSEDTRYKGNQYSTYSTAVQEIEDKYNATADWGVLQTGNIIGLRSAFIINQGIKVYKKDPTADKELDWAKDFLTYNGLDREVSQQFADEAEIEGKIALKIAPEKTTDSDGKEKTMISVRFVSWTEKKYTIEAAPEDYLQYKKMTWRPKDKDKDEVLEENQFVYKKFGGRITKPNQATPKIMRCLTQIDNLDKALRDWREIDRIFSSPILNVKCETERDVKLSKQALDDKNWKLKKIFVSTTELKYSQFDIKGIDAIEREIETNSKIISGTTGIPVHFLGFTDILKQISTADNLMESIKAATLKERETWKGAYEEAIKKSMIMANNETGDNQMSKDKRLDQAKIGVEIPFITKAEWDRLINFYLPAAVANKISDETLHKNIPGLDDELEKKLKEEKDQSDIEFIKRDRDKIRKDLDEKNREEEI